MTARLQRPIIRSVLDNDLYSLTMAQAIMRWYDRVNVGYTFNNRGGTKFSSVLTNALRQQINFMADLQLTDEEENFLRIRCGHYLRPSFIDWLSQYRFNPDEVVISHTNGNLSVTIEGPWYRTVFWEVPLLAVISELYFGVTGTSPDQDYRNRAFTKARTFCEHGIKFSDFGTRRRYSQEVHENVIQELMRGGKASLVGTSNVDLARRYQLTPIGTHGHQWFMAHAGMYGYRMANMKALEVWAQEFGGYLGFALTDTFTTDVFLSDFNAYYAKLFDGVRQDSGDPMEFADRMIEHYRFLKVDPRDKQIVFSDGLNVPAVLDIQKHVSGRIKEALFGIGTDLTNDVGVTPLNIVIKLDHLRLPENRNRPVYVVKFSDSPGKVTGRIEAVQHASYSLGLTD